MYYYIFGITDKGNYREQNEDCILIDHEVINSGSYESTVAVTPVTLISVIAFFMASHKSELLMPSFRPAFSQAALLCKVEVEL